MITNDMYLDFNALNTSLIQEPEIANRLAKAYELVGGVCWNKEKTLLKGAKVFLCGVGGLLLENKNDGTYLMNTRVEAGTLKNEIMKMAGASAFMSYLNGSNLELDALGDKIVNVYEHTSVLHTMSLNILVIGHTIGVEHELASQRDIVHLSRLTVAKTSAQDSPCLTLRNAHYLSVYETVLKQTQKAILEEHHTLDRETQNLLFPSAKSSMILLSGTIKNLNKLVALKNAGGKEDEFIEILEQIEVILNKVLKH